MIASRALRFSALFLPALLGGCGSHSNLASSTTGRPLTIKGLVHGGQQPVGYSTIQLYTVGISGDGSNSTPLLTQTVTTDGGGGFSITGLYNNCTGATEVYLTATGGYVTPTQQNPNLVMMVALGACSSLSPSTDITINELTTIAAVNALYPYMLSVTAIGSGSSDASALDDAFTLAGEFVNIATGTAPGANVPSGYSVPAAEIDSLGNTMAACVNSAGGKANDGSACGTFFGLTTPTGGTAPTNTVAALLSLANNPTLQTSSIYYSASPTPPFQPALSAPPPNFSVALVPSALSLSISPSSVTFPSTVEGTTATAVPLTLYNNSNGGTVTLSSIGIVGVSASEFSLSNGCGATLATQTSCTIQVSATPTAVGGQNAWLVVASNAGESPQYVPLIVTGMAPGAGGAVTLSAATVGWTLATPATGTAH